MLLRPTASLCHRLRCAAQGVSVPLWRSMSRPLSVKVTTDMIKELRAATGAPMMECKAALADPEVRDQLAMAVVGGASTGHPDIAPPWPPVLTFVDLVHPVVWLVVAGGAGRAMAWAWRGIGDRPPFSRCYAVSVVESLVQVVSLTHHKEQGDPVTLYLFALHTLCRGLRRRVCR